MDRLFRLLVLLLVPAAALALSPSAGVLAKVMLALITFVALVIDRFADRYLQGQEGRSHFRRWFVATIASASILVVASDLRVMAVAWTASSLSLHQLLVFFPDRAQAQAAAHKKFLLSRLADLAIYASVYLLGAGFGTYAIDRILEQSITAPLPSAATAAGYLLVAGVVLRTAQLPFHGWLIQVMEAPTPVSALLHAGVVNIGGFVLIRLAPLIGQLQGARAVLVIVGALTAALAALVALTRVSIKVSLAWSTAAQMGFMLLECGLGAWELALLHLVAHSLYKAHAFLQSGSTVGEFVRRGSPARPAVTGAPLRWGIGVAIALALSALTVVALRFEGSGGEGVAFMSIVMLTLALAPVLARSASHSWRDVTARGGVALVVALAFVASHLALRGIAPPPAPVPTWHLAFTLLVFATLLFLQIMIDVRPYGRIATRLYPLVYAGFHLDALFTRATFRLWPPSRSRTPRTLTALVHPHIRRAA